MSVPHRYYLLLGVPLGERDPKALEEAALRRSAQVRAYQITCEQECTRLLNEIAHALTVLLDEDDEDEGDAWHTAPAEPLRDRFAGVRPAPGGRRAPDSLEVALVPVAVGAAVARCEVEVRAWAGW